jgi:hypothetical protein
VRPTAVPAALKSVLGGTFLTLDSDCGESSVGPGSSTLDNRRRTREGTRLGQYSLLGTDSGVPP